MANVINLETGEIQVYSCSPQEAVVCAYEQSRKNFNTWSYNYSQVKISASGKTVFCGNFSAVLTGECAYNFGFTHALQCKSLDNPTLDNPREYARGYNDGTDLRRKLLLIPN